MKATPNPGLVTAGVATSTGTIAGTVAKSACRPTADHLFAPTAFATMKLPQVPFASGILYHGLFNNPCPRIGGYLFVKLRNDGDEILMPDSADGFASTGPGVGLPGIAADSFTGLAVMLALIAAGVLAHAGRGRPA